ncbi:MAG TPA: VWA domain-containing protein [Terriglobales bacterium]|nr:VWA domain-containing protein [Terriglobales bacterium]
MFRSETSLVNVAFSARDAQGSLVPDLRADELEVLENGLPRKIAFFSHSTGLPLTLGLVLDQSPSQDKYIKAHARDLQRFLTGLLTPSDRAFLVGFGDHIRLISDYTPAAATLLWTLAHYQRKYAYPELGPQLERDGGTALFDALDAAVAQKLRGQTGRRVLLVFSDGEDNSSAHDEGAVLAAAQDADVTIYTIRYLPDRRMTARDYYGTAVMQRLAGETGGQPVDAARIEPRQFFAVIAGELRASYQLAYYPPSGAPPGFRAIQIRCTRPGITIQSRRGYTAQP